MSYSVSGLFVYSSWFGFTVRLRTQHRIFAIPFPLIILSYRWKQFHVRPLFSMLRITHTRVTGFFFVMVTKETERISSTSVYREVIKIGSSMLIDRHHDLNLESLKLKVTKYKLLRRWKSQWPQSKNILDSHTPTPLKHSTHILSDYFDLYLTLILICEDSDPFCVVK